MIRQLVRSEGMSFYVDPGIARIPKTVCANKHLAAKVVEKTPEPVAGKANPTDVIGAEKVTNAEADKVASKEPVAVKEEKPQESNITFCC